MIYHIYGGIDIYKCCNNYINSMNDSFPFNKGSGNNSLNINDGYWAMNETEKLSYERFLLTLLSNMPDNPTYFANFEFPEEDEIKQISSKTLLGSLFYSGKMIENEKVLEAHHFVEDDLFKKKVKFIKEYITSFIQEEKKIKSQLGLDDSFTETKSESSSSNSEKNSKSSEKSSGTSSDTENSNSSTDENSNWSESSSKTITEKTTKVKTTTTTVTTESKGIIDKRPDMNRIDDYGEKLKEKIEAETEHCTKDWEAKAEASSIKAETIMNKRENEFKNLDEWYEMEYGDIKGKKAQSVFTRIEKEEKERKAKKETKNKGGDASNKGSVDNGKNSAKDENSNSDSKNSQNGNNSSKGKFSAESNIVHPETFVIPPKPILQKRNRKRRRRI